jgi:TrmH family RNA methyltransferase
MSASILMNCRVVLVRTHYAGNIGSTARAMLNFGLRDLVLVDPIASVTSHEARMLATRGVDILDSARIVPDLHTAIADCGFVLASSGETAGTERLTARGTPADWFPQLLATLATTQCALVFGPEPHGLANEEIGLCHGLLYLPADPDYNSMNISLAVGIALYELRRFAALDAPTIARTPAPFADFDRAMIHLEASMKDLRFLFGQNADLLMNGVRHLIGRAAPTPLEVKLLHGLARQLDYAADQMKKAETQLRAPK